MTFLVAEFPIELRRLWIFVVVFLQPQEAQMPRVLTGEAGDLDVIPHEVVLRRKLVHGSFEELLLVIPTGTPRENAADVEVFAYDVPHHVGRRDAFGRGFVVSAAGGVDMMIA